MKNDNLGLIATLHQILADQRHSGTFDPDLPPDPCCWPSGRPPLGMDLFEGAFKRLWAPWYGPRDQYPG